MIYTVTLSPTLDYIVELGHKLQEGDSYKVHSEQFRAGGRGLNVSHMLKNLGSESTALGFVAGFTGDELMRLSATTGVKTGFIRARNGRTRVNLRLNSNARTTKINGLGPKVSDADIDYMLKKCDSLQADDFLVLAGDIPSNQPRDIYHRFFERVANKEVKIIVDAGLDIAMTVVQLRPFLFKTNEEDICNYLQQDELSLEQLQAFSLQLRQQGAEHVAIALNNLSLLITGSDFCYMVHSPKVEFVDAIGAEDSIIAGFLHAYSQDHDWPRACELAAACGIASLSEYGIAEASHAYQLLEQVTIESL